MSSTGTLTLTFTGPKEDVDAFQAQLERVQVLLALPSASFSALVGTQILLQLAEQMLARGLPLGFYDEAPDEFIQIACPQLDNLVTIARERSQFPEDTESPPSP